MHKLKNSFIILLTLVFGFIVSCKDLDELNINPNGVDPAIADVNFLLPTVQTNLGQTVYNIGFGTFSGVMQHTQQTGWFGGYNNYDWNTLSHSWNGYYSILMNNDEYFRKAVDHNYEFHEGVARIMRAYVFGLITDIWGDAPYKDALKAEQGSDHFMPAFDPQQEIYHGILADLDTANTLLSKSANEYRNIVAKQDVVYNGGASKWQKFANSLALRYYMRLQAKEPAFAEEGIKRIVEDPAQYPLIRVAGDDANISFPGTSNATSNPLNTVYDVRLDGNYMRTKMGKTLVDVLRDYNDPRLAVWANKIQIPLKLVSGTGIDQINDNGEREVSQDLVTAFEANGMKVDFDPEYAGVTISHPLVQIFNMNNANAAQGTVNPHASHLNNRYRLTTDPLVLMRLISAAEVNLILAEAAYRGWIANDPAEYYAEGVMESFKAWGVEGEFEDYIENVPYDGLESIIEQKWIAHWTTAHEAWFDWRRTGLPTLETGPAALRPVLPIRWYYHTSDEIEKNRANAEAAIERLEATPYQDTDQSKNSAWSKMWLLQGTGKPW
ncbi:SusD/RagB family nutrient-binding outer membrane lipoprotein [uncultured Proteiniphilum sp.]|uniref:SusD/RagB family nutrient-binding outer membrane lipoprotein n=1 Tax=uncultured Proteiniphilum sp. TaxID=497637 RepID=UPI00263545AB|nr:SusD/RagB family nutrient-binding outer membrane lipoprotein [uncultured Proteiniphilum sp.]